MSMPDAFPPLVDVESLTALAPDARRSATTRAMCRRRLARQRHRRDSNAVRKARAIRILTPVIVGACGLLYAAAFLVTTLQLEDLLF